MGRAVPINTEALTRLADLIDQPDLINLRSWARFPHDTEPHFMTNHCGFVACAIGHAMVEPWFNERGFGGSREFPLSPSYKGETSWTAVKDFFGLTPMEAVRLFDSRYYSSVSNPTGSEVALRIRQFIKEKSK